VILLLRRESPSLEDVSIWRRKSTGVKLELRGLKSPRPQERTQRFKVLMKMNPMFKRLMSHGPLGQNTFRKSSHRSEEYRV
jgi:hypothetical protein